eukprot:INCI6298.2.p1 GENE.INCI6298.2~~INCI6298.2.p1  ORF type:complete len:1047 (-),score=160.24 INCI6298.2:437-3577(-)
MSSLTAQQELAQLQLELQRERQLRNELKTKNVQLQNEVSELRDEQDKARQREEDLGLHFQTVEEELNLELEKVRTRNKKQVQTLRTVLKTKDHELNALLAQNRQAAPHAQSSGRRVVAPSGAKGAAISLRSARVNANGTAPPNRTGRPGSSRPSGRRGFPGLPVSSTPSSSSSSASTSSSLSATSSAETHRPSPRNLPGSVAGGALTPANLKLRRHSSVGSSGSSGSAGAPPTASPRPGHEGEDTTDPGSRFDGISSFVLESASRDMTQLLSVLLLDSSSIDAAVHESCRATCPVEQSEVPTKTASNAMQRREKKLKELWADLVTCIEGLQQAVHHNLSLHVLLPAFEESILIVDNLLGVVDGGCQIVEAAEYDVQMDFTDSRITPPDRELRGETIAARAHKLVASAVNVLELLVLNFTHIRRLVQGAPPSTATPAARNARKAAQNSLDTILADSCQILEANTQALVYGRLFAEKTTRNEAGGTHSESQLQTPGLPVLCRLLNSPLWKAGSLCSVALSVCVECLRDAPDVVLDGTIDLLVTNGVLQRIILTQHPPVPCPPRLSAPTNRSVTGETPACALDTQKSPGPRSSSKKSSQPRRPTAHETLGISEICLSAVLQSVSRVDMRCSKAVALFTNLVASKRVFAQPEAKILAWHLAKLLPPRSFLFQKLSADYERCGTPVPAALNVLSESSSVCVQATHAVLFFFARVLDQYGFAAAGFLDPSIGAPPAATTRGTAMGGTVSIVSEPRKKQGGAAANASRRAETSQPQPPVAVQVIQFLHRAVDRVALGVSARFDKLSSTLSVAKPRAPRSSPRSPPEPRQTLDGGWPLRIPRAAHEALLQHVRSERRRQAAAQEPAVSPSVFLSDELLSEMVARLPKSKAQLRRFIPRKHLKAGTLLSTAAWDFLRTNGVTVSGKFPLAPEVEENLGATADSHAVSGTPRAGQKRRATAVDSPSDVHAVGIGSDAGPKSSVGMDLFVLQTAVAQLHLREHDGFFDGFETDFGLSSSHGLPKSSLLPSLPARLPSARVKHAEYDRPAPSGPAGLV